MRAGLETSIGQWRGERRHSLSAVLCTRGERAIAGLREALSSLPHRIGHRPILRTRLGKGLRCRIFGVEPGLLRHAFNCRSIDLEAEMRRYALPRRGGQIGVVDA